MSLATSQNVSVIIKDQFKKLPVSVQHAITDASVEKKLRALSSKHKLHLDQWVLLENEIMLTLLGIEEPENMAANIAREVHTDATTAQALVSDIATEIFDPIRVLLQKELAGTSARVGNRPTVTTDPNADIPTLQGSGDEKSAEREAFSTKGNPTPAIPAQPSSGAYQSGVPSHARKEIADDPYREQIV